MILCLCFGVIETLIGAAICGMIGGACKVLRIFNII